MAQLYEILISAGVQETFADKLKEDGWTSDLFAMCATTQDGFKDELPDMLGTFHAVTTPHPEISTDVGLAPLSPVLRSANESGTQPVRSSR